MKRRSTVGLAMRSLAMLALPGLACAQTFPAKPITVIVPFAVGGRVIKDAAIRLDWVEPAFPSSNPTQRNDHETASPAG